MRRARGIDDRLKALPLGLFVALSAVILLAKIYSLAQLPRLEGADGNFALLAAALGDSLRELVVAALISLSLAGALALFRFHALHIAAALVACLAALLVVILNIAAAELLPVFGSPPTIGLLYYSDLLFSRNGLIAVVSWIGLEMATLLVASLLVCIAALLSASRIRAWRDTRLLAAAIAVVLAASALAQTIASGDDRYRASAVAAFVESARILQPDLLLSGSGDAQPIPAGTLQRRAPIDPARAAEIRNVIVIVVESAGAAYFDQYGGGFGVTPSLSRPDALRVDNAYTQSVSSTLAMQTLFSGRYPAITLRQQPPGRDLLPRVLGDLGWRTALFHSSDTRYQAAESWLSPAFGEVRDFRHRRCGDARFEDVSEFNSQANSDACTFADLRRWIDANEANPFFTALWTFQTHYPYFTTGRAAPVRLPSDLQLDERTRELKQRYLTALRETDALIGQLLRFLEERGLLSQTLVIVTGDHGEAFRQHGTFGHGNDLYEESVRVPMFVIAPGLSKRGSFDRLTGHIDVAPTILGVLGVPQPASWDGTSLYSPRREQPVYFFSPWTDLMIGYRHREDKVIAKLLSREAEQYNLARDPAERLDLAAGNEALQERHLEAVAAWVRSMRSPVK